MLVLFERQNVNFENKKLGGGNSSSKFDAIFGKFFELFSNFFNVTQLNVKLKQTKFNQTQII